MKKILSILCALLLLPAAAFAAEGDPLLSVDDLMTIEDSYRTFLSELEELIVSRGLLDESEREAWRDAQMGDFYQNGGYGSVLTSYMPGVLSLAREEETLLTLRAAMPDGDLLELVTMRRYTPQDSSLSGLMLTLSVTGADGLPREAAFSLGAMSGLFFKWDAMLGAYVSVGTSAESDGETVVWSDQTPADGAGDVTVTIGIADAQTGEPVAVAELTLAVEGDGYRIADDALTCAPADNETIGE